MYYNMFLTIMWWNLDIKNLHYNKVLDRYNELFFKPQEKKIYRKEP